MPKFVLFDIDGTLIYSGGAGARAMNRALEELAGINEGFRGIDCSGKTDLLIISEALEKHDLNSRDGVVDDLLGLYLTCLKFEVAKGDGYVKPGVQELLQALHGIEDVHLGLLTGNIEEGARLKLAPYGLNQFFPVGAYGNDDEDRNRLLPIALQRLWRTTGIALPYRDCVVIGDTPRDVECARIHGSPCIAVATGTYPFEALEATGADLVVPDLSDTHGILEWIASL